MLILATVEAIEAPSAALRAELSSRPAGPAQHAEALARPARPPRDRGLFAARAGGAADAAGAHRLLERRAAEVWRGFGAAGAQPRGGCAAAGRARSRAWPARATGTRCGTSPGPWMPATSSASSSSSSGWATRASGAGTRTTKTSTGCTGAGCCRRIALLRPALLRLETSGRWFDGGLDERRIGGRIAVMAELLVMGRPVLLVAVHYESHTGPEDRLAQTRDHARRDRRLCAGAARC